MRENLISTLEKNYSLYQNLFLPGLGKGVWRLVRHPYKVIVRMLQIRFFKGKSFLVGTKTFFGYPMTIHSFEYYLWFAGCLTGTEVPLQKYIIKYYDTNGVFLDIGAHHGFYTLLAHKLITGEGGKGAIHAFEPTDLHYTILKKNVSTFSSITLNKKAVCSTPGQRTFYENVKGKSTIEKALFRDVPSSKNDIFTSIEVDCITLDDYCAEHKLMPSFIKIDVEGSEYEVLRGATRILTEGSPTIALEAWSRPYDNSNHLKAIELLERQGYSASHMTDSGDCVPIRYEALRELLNGTGNSNNFIFQK